MKNIFTLFIALAPAFLPGVAAFAAGEGTSSGVFLTLPSDPAVAALGGPGAVAWGGPSTLLNNPAGLAGVASAAAQLSHAAWLEGLNYNILSAAVPLKAGGVIGIGVRQMGYGKIDALDNTGAPAGDISPRDMAVSLGYGRELVGGWSAGLAGKYIDSRISASASAFALDGGLQYRRNRLALGASFENLGGKLKYNSEAYQLPLTFKTAGAYKIAAGWKLFASCDIPRSGAARAGAGAQRVFAFDGSFELAARAGYTSRYSRTGGFNGFSGGLGLTLKDFTFDYALSSLGELGLTHHFGIALRWGGSAAASEDDGPGLGVMFLN